MKIKAVSRSLIAACLGVFAIDQQVALKNIHGSKG
jgi:hypothetical protein